MRLALGDVTAGQLRALAVLRSAFGDGTVRLTPDQNLFLRWVPDGAVQELFERLAAAGLATSGRVDDSRCHELPGCRIVQARGHAVTRARPGA